MRYLICFFFAMNLYGSACEFIVDDASYFNKDLGNIIISKSTKDTIWISNRSPVSLTNIDSDSMFVLANNTVVNYLRFSALNEAVIDSGSIKIQHISWAYPEISMQGKYSIKSYKSNRKPQFNKTLSTIGDSITWACFGRYLRCLLRDEGLEYDFVGTHTDTFGFGHEGQGGNTTTQVLNRINAIPYADAYFLLIGTNDWMEKLLPIKTISNIKEISLKLSNKNSQATIYISTLLPTKNTYIETIKTINKLLLEEKNICDHCVVLDVGGEFLKTPNWENYLTDARHPTLEGYRILAKIISSLILKQTPIQ